MSVVKGSLESALENEICPLGNAGGNLGLCNAVQKMHWAFPSKFLFEMSLKFRSKITLQNALAKMP